MAATCDAERRKLSVSVVNRHETQPITTAISVRGWQMPGSGTAFEINGSSPDVVNSLETPNNVTTSHKPLNKAGDKLEYTFPAHSVTLLKFGA